MKRLLTVLLLLALLCAPAAFAEEEMAELRHEEYTLAYPRPWHLDDTSYDDESTDTQIWVGDLFEGTNDGLYVECWIVRISAYDGFADAFENAASFTLKDADEAAREAYKQYWLDSAERDGLEPTFLQTLEAEGEGATFLLFRMNDGDGAYVYATTVEEGSEYCFFCYRNDYADMTDDQMAALRALLAGFTPLGRAGYNA